MKTLLYLLRNKWNLSGLKTHNMPLEKRRKKLAFQFNR